MVELIMKITNNKKLKKIMANIFNLFKLAMIIICLMMVSEDYLMQFNNRIQWVIIMVITMILLYLAEKLKKNDNDI